ncbi:hypothetical protein [Lederbergia lenta]|uniref:hypothetical protein n=1 Tax=Lederbergia lenta TaxID=1467 RepID=UPI00203F013B|nr:hypothetical protein [Lederbergia lenta]MCM3109909.1 hypothetical protein [Lederbergia lenta]
MKKWIKIKLRSFLGIDNIESKHKEDIESLGRVISNLDIKASTDITRVEGYIDMLSVQSTQKEECNREDEQL